MLRVLRTYAQWQDLPRGYGTKSTSRRRFQKWVDAGVFEEILKTLAGHLSLYFQRSSNGLTPVAADVGLG
jgi:transposase